MCNADNSYNPTLQSVRDLQAESWSQNLSLSLQTNVRRVVEYIDQVKYWQLPGLAAAGSSRQSLQTPGEALVVSELKCGTRHSPSPRLWHLWPLEP